jgi:hypothetical protein
MRYPNPSSHRRFSRTLVAIRTVARPAGKFQLDWLTPSAIIRYRLFVSREFLLSRIALLASERAAPQRGNACGDLK